MTSINKFVATGFLALVASVSLSLPTAADAATRKAAATPSKSAPKALVVLRNRAPVHVAVVRRVTHNVVVVRARNGALQRVATAHIEPARPSFGTLYGVRRANPAYSDWLEVTYSYGKDDVPADLKLAVLGIAAGFYNWAIGGQKEIVSTQVGSYRVEYAGSSSRWVWRQIR